jgi:hypothetical protein
MDHGDNEENLVFTGTMKRSFLHRSYSSTAPIRFPAIWSASISLSAQSR